MTHERRSYSITVDEMDKAQDFFEQMESESRTTIDPLISLTAYVAGIGNRYLRGLDLTSTGSGYRGGIQLRVLPAQGHLPLPSITTGIIDRTIDFWELTHSVSTVKNTVAALTKVLDEAVRDDVIATNPARARAKRRSQPTETPATHKIPTLTMVLELASACSSVHSVYGDFVLLCALLAARSSEVAGLLVGDVDWDRELVTIARQHFPGAGGLSVKPTKSRRSRAIPILRPLEPVLRRLTNNRDSRSSTIGKRGIHSSIRRDRCEHNRCGKGTITSDVRSEFGAR